MNSKYFERISVKRICITGFILRLVMLTVVVLFSKDVSTGLIGSTNTQDDVRYLAGAELYAQTASSIIDPYALEKAFDQVEPQGGHEEVELWYWIISVLFYIFKNDVFLRIVNILFAVASIKCIYDITKLLYNTQIAKFASFLYATLPYPIIFSCFLYKDQFYTMLTLLLFRKSFLCAGHINSKDLIYLAIGLVLSQLTRSGLVVMIFLAIALIIYKQGNYKIKFSTVLVGSFLFVSVLYFFIMQNLDSIMIKIYAYIFSASEESGSTISMFEIKSPSQIYRYPFALLFMMVLPLNLTLQMDSWISIAGILNLIGLPMAMGNFLYLLNYRMKKNYFFWIGQFFFFVTILASLGIFRHQYYLQPFMMIFFAYYYYKHKNHTALKIASISSVVLVLMIWTSILLKGS